MRVQTRNALDRAHRALTHLAETLDTEPVGEDLQAEVERIHDELLEAEHSFGSGRPHREAA